MRFTVAASAARVTAQHAPSNSVCVCCNDSLRPFNTHPSVSPRPLPSRA